jgi:hypothetical protein
MGNQEDTLVEEEIREIKGNSFKFIITHRSTVGVDESYSRTYGDIVFKCEEGYNGLPEYTFNFDDKAQVSVLHKNGKQSDNIFYVLEALSRGISCNDAAKEAYKNGTQKVEDLRPVLNPDDTLEEEYREDLSRLLEEEFWKEEEEGEELVSRRTARR